MFVYKTTVLTIKFVEINKITSVHSVQRNERELSAVGVFFEENTKVCCSNYSFIKMKIR